MLAPSRAVQEWAEVFIASPFIAGILRRVS